MSKIITVGQRKGGVGKTSLAIAIAAELSVEGWDTVLVDADPQASACHWAEPGNLAFSVYQLPLRDQPVKDWALAIRRICANHRLVVIDTAPDPRALGACVALSAIVLVPCTPSTLDIDATAQTLTIVNEVRKRRHNPLEVVLVPNRVDHRLLEGRQFEAELVQFGETVAPAIGNRVAFARAAAAGLSVHDLSPDSSADLEIRALTRLLVPLLT